MSLQPCTGRDELPTSSSAPETWIENAQRLGHYARRHAWARAAIARLLASPSARIRLRAPPALSALAGRDHPAREDLRRLCADPDARVREAAGFWLARAGAADDAVLDVVRGALGRDAHVRAGVARGLRDATVLSAAALDLLPLLACDDDGRVRAAAVESIGAAESRRPIIALRLLTDLLFFTKHGDDYISQGAAAALAQLLRRRAPGALKLVQRLARDSTDSRRWCAARALAGCPTPGSSSARRLLTMLARDPAPIVRAELAVTAGELAATRLVDAEPAANWAGPRGALVLPARAVLEQLADDSDGLVRSAAAEAAGRAAASGQTWALTALGSFGAAADHNLRLGAAAGLGACAPSAGTAAVALLRNLARDQWGVVRARAAEACGRAWGISDQARAALLALAADPHPEVRAATARALGAVALRQAQDRPRGRACPPAAGEGRPEPSRGAADPGPAHEQVWQAVDTLRWDDDAAVRRSAITALGRMAVHNPQRAGQLLAEHLDAGGPELAQALAAALAVNYSDRPWAVMRLAVAIRDERIMREIAATAHDSLTADLMNALADVVAAEPVEEHLDRLAAVIEAQEHQPGIAELAVAIKSLASLLRARTLEELVAAEQPLSVMSDFPRVIASIPSMIGEHPFEPPFEHVRAALSAGSWAERLRHIAAAVSLVERLRSRVAESPAVLVRRVGSRVLAVLSAVLSTILGSLRDQAEVSVELLPQQVYLDTSEVTIALRLRNQGTVPALNVRARAEAAPPYALAPAGGLSRPEIAPGAEELLTLRLAVGSPTGDGPPDWRSPAAAGRDVTLISGSVDYDDPLGDRRAGSPAAGGQGRRVDFACNLELAPPPSGPCAASNPFVPGKPLVAGSPLFVGRGGVFDFLREALHGAYQENVVALIGPRRIGKTSILRQAEAHLGDLYWPVFVDVQGTLVEDVGALLHAVAERCRDVVGVPAEVPPAHAFADDPAMLPRFLEQVVREAAAAGGRPPGSRPPDRQAAAGPAGGRPPGKRLLIMLDEFDDLEQKVRSGLLPESTFTYLRHLIQHSPGIAFLLSGTNRLEELGEDYWSFLFNLAIYHRVGRLELGATCRAVGETMARAGIACDELAAYRVWELSGGHPYFLQLIGHYLVGRCQRAARPYLTYDAVEAEVGAMLEWGDTHSSYLWNAADAVEQVALAAICGSGGRLPVGRPAAGARGCASAEEIADAIRPHGCHLAPAALSHALDGLLEKDLAAQVGRATPRYRSTMGILAAWIEANQPLSRVARRAGAGAE